MWSYFLMSEIFLLFGLLFVQEINADCSTPVTSVVGVISNQEPGIGTRVTLTCTVTPPAAVTECSFPINWIRDMSDVTQDCLLIFGGPRYSIDCSQQSQGIFRLIINEVNLSDRAMWACSFLNNGNQMQLNVLVPPSKPLITSTPASTLSSKLSVKERSSVSLSCNAAYGDASIPITYSWRRNDTKPLSGVISDNMNKNVLTFSSIQQTDAAAYICTASNKVGSQQSDPFTVEVYYPPQKIELTAPIPGVSVGATARWLCAAVGGNPVPTLELYKQRRGATGWEKITTPERNRQITFNEISKVDDNGAKMKCSAKSAGITNKMDSLPRDYVVFFMPTDIIMTKDPNRDVDPAGTKKTITCESASSNPATEIIWERVDFGSQNPTPVTATANKGPGANDGIVTSSRIELVLREQHNLATYRCKALYNNTALGYQRSLTLQVLFPPLSVHLTDVPQTAVAVGQRKSLTCMTDSSNPASAITWYRQRLPDNNREIVTNGITTETIGAHSGKVATHTININTTREDHRATYRCVVKYLDNNSYKEKSITLNIYYPPVNVSVKSTPGSPVTEGSRVTLTCQAVNGFPMYGLVYQWEKRDAGVTQAVGANSANYVINSVNSGHAGGYVCKVTNSGGTTASSVFLLDVNYAPKLQKAQSKTVFAGKIGGNVEFKFVFTAKPIITACTCRRKDNNAALPSNALVNQNNANVCTLSFLDIKTSDFGTYVCSVINTVSDLSFDVELKTPGPPDMPTLQTLVDITSTSATIQWQAGFQGGSTQTFTIEYQKINDPKWQYVRNIPDPGYKKIVKHKVTGLEPASQYKFRIQAINNQLAENWSPYTPEFLAFTKAAPTTLSKDIKVTKSGPSVTISWKDINYGGVSSNVIDIRVKYCESGDQKCHYHRVSEFDRSQKKTTFTVDNSKSYEYYLQILDSATPVFTSEALVDIQAADMQNIIIGVAVAIVVVLVIVVVVFIFLRRQRLQKKKQGADCSNPMVGTHELAPCDGMHNTGLQSTPTHSEYAESSFGGSIYGGARPKASPRKKGKVSSPYENQQLPNPDVIPDENPYQNVGMMIGPGFGPDSYDENPYQNVRMSSPNPEDIGADGTVYADVDVPSFPHSNGTGNQTRPKEILGDLDFSEYSVVDFTRPGPDVKTLNLQLDKSHATVV